jgi:hypothetical protein
MSRLNLTLDDDTFSAISRDARKQGVPVATHARRRLRDALARRARVEARKLWADAYAEGRGDGKAPLEDWEPGALEVLGDETG